MLSTEIGFTLAATLIVGSIVIAMVLGQRIGVLGASVVLFVLLVNVLDLIFGNDRLVAGTPKTNTDDFLMGLAGGLGIGLVLLVACLSMPRSQPDDPDDRNDDDGPAPMGPA